LCSSSNLPDDPVLFNLKTLFVEVVNRFGGSRMKTLTAVALALAVSTGAAFAQGSGSSGGGGTDAGPGGVNTGKDAAAQNPTTQQCAKGWDSSMRMTRAEFDEKCKKQ
jgi:hypothetical protein